MQWRERLFLNLAIFTCMAAIAAFVGVATWFLNIGVPRPAILALLSAGAVGILYYLAPAVAAKFHEWAG